MELQTSHQSERPPSKSLQTINAREGEEERDLLTLLVGTYARMLSRFSHVQLFETQGTAACQAPLFMGFSRQEDWSGLLCPPPRDLPHLGIKPTSLTSPALAGTFFTTSTAWEAQGKYMYV